MKDVYFCDTNTQWNKLKIASGNEPLIGATIHYDYFRPNTGISLSKTSFTYNGKVQVPTLKVLRKGKALVKGTDYTVTWSNASSKNVGAYKVTIKGIGNYAGTAVLSYQITKAANPLTVKGKTCKVKVNTLKKKAVLIKRTKALTVTKAKGKVTYKLVSVKKAKFKKYFKVNTGTGKIRAKRGLKKGTYKLKISVKAAGNKNYEELEKTVTIKIKVK